MINDNKNKDGLFLKMCIINRCLSVADGLGLKKVNENENNGACKTV